MHVMDLGDIIPRLGSIFVTPIAFGNNSFTKKEKDELGDLFGELIIFLQGVMK